MEDNADWLLMFSSFPKLVLDGCVGLAVESPIAMESWIGFSVSTFVGILVGRRHGLDAKIE